MAGERSSAGSVPAAKRRKLDGRGPADGKPHSSYTEMDLDGDIDDASLVAAVDHIERAHRALPRALVRQRNGDFLCKAEHDRNLQDPQCGEERNPLNQVVLILTWEGAYLQPPSFKKWAERRLRNMLKSEAKWQLERQLGKELDLNDSQQKLLFEKRLGDLVDRGLDSFLSKRLEEAGFPEEPPQTEWQIDHRMMIRSPDDPNRFVEAHDLRRQRPGAFVMARDIFVQDGTVGRHFQHNLEGNFRDLPYWIERERKAEYQLLTVQAPVLAEMKRATAEAFSDPRFPWPPDTPELERKELAYRSWLRDLEVSDDHVLRFGLRLTFAAPIREAGEDSSSDSEDELPIVKPQGISRLPGVNLHGFPRIRRAPDSVAASPSRESVSNIGTSQDSVSAAETSTPPSSQSSLAGAREPDRAKTDRGEERNRRSRQGR